MKPQLVRKKVSAKDKQKKFDDQIYILNDITKIKVGRSDIHGVGIIAMRDMKKGEKLNADAVFQYFDLPYKKFKMLRPEVREHLLERWPNITKGSLFVYPDAKMLAFMNHSDNPNYDSKEDKLLRGVKAGEEIFEDYRLIDGYKDVYKWLDK